MTQITSILSVANYINSPELAIGIQRTQWQKIDYNVLKWFKAVSRTATAPREVEKLLIEGKLAGTPRHFDTLLDNTWASPNDLSTTGFQELQYVRNNINIAPILVSKTVIQASDAVRIASQDGAITPVGMKIVADALYKMTKELLEKYNSYLITALPTLISTGGGIFTELYSAVGDYLEIPTLLRDKMYEGIITTAEGNKLNTEDLYVLGNTLLRYETMVNYESQKIYQDKYKDQFVQPLNVMRSSTLPRVDTQNDYSVAYVAQGGTIGLHEFTVNNYSYPEVFTTSDVDISAINLPKIFGDVPDVKATLAIKKTSKDNSGSLIGSFGQWSYLDTQVEMYLAFQPIIIPIVTSNTNFKGVLGFVIQ